MHDPSKSPSLSPVSTMKGTTAQEVKRKIDSKVRETRPLCD